MILNSKEITNSSFCKNKHKDTEIGLIPTEWEVINLNKIAAIIDPHPSHRAPPEVLDGIPFVGIGDILPTGEIKRESCRLVHQSIFDEHVKRYDLNNGLIGIGRVASIGKVIRFREPIEKYTISPTIAVINPEGIDKNYLYYYLSSDAAIKQFDKISNGSTRQSVGMQVLRDIIIICPPLPEQKAIAQALSDVDDLISALEALIEKKQNIKQGTMQELLTGKRRLPGFSEEWEEKRLNEVANIIDPHPSHRAPPEQPNGIPFVGIGDVSINGVINKDSARFVGEYVYDEHKKRYDLNNGLIGIGRVASIGKIVKFKATEDKYTISPTIAVIESKSVNKDLLYYKLSSSEITDQFIKICSGSTRQSVGMHVLRELTLTVPKSAKEQLTISQLISNMDNEIERLEQQRDKTKLLKQGMMQELLTGKTRLI